MTGEPVNYRDRIVADPSILVGKPTIKGTRITVEAILQRLASNPDPGALLADFPELTMDDLKAALAYVQAVLRDAQAQEAARQRRFRRMLAVAQRNPDVDGDLLLEELEREDAERRAQARA
jgi:uncharacterized protein (DUF433 family)